MAKKVIYGVTYTAYGYATTTVPDSVQTRDDAIKWLKEHWDELPLPEEADYIPESDELDLESDIELFEEEIQKGVRIKYRHISNPSVFKEFNTHIAFVRMPNIFKGNRSQLEYDAFTLNKLKEDKKRGIILEYRIVDDKCIEEKN